MEGLKKNEYYMTPDQVEGFSQKLQQYFAYGQKFLVEKKATFTSSSSGSLLREPSSVPEPKEGISTALVSEVKNHEELPSSVPDKAETPKLVKKPAALTIKKSELSPSILPKADKKDKIEDQLKKDMHLSKAKDGELDYTFATTAAEVLRLRSGTKDESFDIQYKEYSSEDELKAIIGEDFLIPFPCKPTEAPSAFTQDVEMDLDESEAQYGLRVVSEDNHSLTLEDWLSSRGIYV
jgi:hypothetical protein